MANFTALTRRKSAGANEALGRELSDSDRRALPAGFEAVGEALVSGIHPAAASAEVGRAYARDGASLGEALDGLRATYQRVLGREPAFGAAESLSTAWSESTLEYLHQLTCEDPLTGLASLAHVRTRLDEIYRETENDGVNVRTAHALVVVEAHSSSNDHFGRALMLAQVAEAIRSVYPGGETVGRVGSDRAVAVVRRRPDLGTSVAVLREYLVDLRLDASEVRVWIEGLPATPESATRLLDELAR
jgi:GGDEF domain-containing protein